MLAQLVGDLDCVFAQDRQRLGAGGRIRQRRPAGDDAGLVARHVGDQQRDHPRRRTGQRQAAALDRRQVLAHAVHLADRRAAFQQRLVDRLFLLQRDAVGRQRQQGRAAARNQAQHQVIGAQAAHHVQHAAGGVATGLVRHRMRSLHHLDALAVGAMAVARDDQAAEFALPVLLDHAGHRRRALAGPDDQRAPAR